MLSTSLIHHSFISDYYKLILFLHENDYLKVVFFEECMIVNQGKIMKNSFIAKNECKRKMRYKESNFFFSFSFFFVCLAPFFQKIHVFQNLC